MLDYCKSADNSNTLYSQKYKEHYHSLKDGALNESLTKHIKPAFSHIVSETTKQINILDICYGLGYNVLSSIYYANLFLPLGIKINIISIELDEKLISSLIDFEYPEEFEPYKHIIQELSTKHNYKDDRFDIKIICSDAREVLKKIKTKFDIVYQDAFSYKKNPTLWTFEYFKDIKSLMLKKSILTTYSISTKIRLALSENNFFIYDNILSGVPKQKIIGTLASTKLITSLANNIDMQEKKQRSNIKKPLYDDNIGEQL